MTIFVWECKSAYHSRPAPTCTHFQRHSYASFETNNDTMSALFLFRYLFNICLKNRANVFESTFNYTICLLKSSLSNKFQDDALVHSVLFSLSSQCVYVYLSNLFCYSCQIAGLRSQLCRGSCAIVDALQNKGHRL